MTGVTAHPQEAMQTAAFEIVLEFPLHVTRQRPPLPGHVVNEHRVMLFDDPVEQGLFGPGNFIR
jgi:hypothetical protein